MTNKNNDRVAPPLIYAFRVAHKARDAKSHAEVSDKGERVVASRRVTSRAPISEAELRKVVNSDLMALMNTTCLDAADNLAEFPHVRSSILNFGFPDLLSRTIDENGVSEITREIEVTLGNYEPNLTRGSIKARRDDTVDPDELQLRFLVKAELRAQPVNVQMEFTAEVELGSGKIKIDRIYR
jgi:type VI secretion system protein ImpF